MYISILCLSTRGVKELRGLSALADATEVGRADAVGDPFDRARATFARLAFAGVNLPSAIFRSVVAVDVTWVELALFRHIESLLKRESDRCEKAFGTRP